MFAAAASIDAIEVTSRTWAHSSHDLFDFEATDAKVCSRTFDIPGCASFASFSRDSNNDVAMQDEGGASSWQMPSGSSTEVLATLNRRKGQFFIDRVKRSEHEGSEQKSQRLWLVVRNLDSSSTATTSQTDGSPPIGGHVLQEDDVFKLGRSRFQVRQIVTKADPDASLLEETSTSCEACPEEAEDEPDKAVCRICLMDGVEDDDIFLQPCGCKGSVRSVHMSCLKYWIGSRMCVPRTGGAYFYQPMACELCKVDYPFRVQLKSGEMKELQVLPKLEPPYIVLGNRGHSRGKDRGLHFLPLEDSKTLKLGRSHDCHVRINDVSISRCQATIRYEDGRFVLEDNRSKFGTLVLLRKPCALQPGRTTTIQAGRTIISFKATPKELLSSPLSPPEVNNLQASDAEGESDTMMVYGDESVACAPYENAATVETDTVCSSSS
jgi:hypothetical protein